MSPKIRQSVRGPYRVAPEIWLRRFAGRLERHIDASERCAKKLRIARTSLFDWITYKRQPKAYDLYLIGKATEVSIDWLLFGETVPVKRTERTAVGELEAALRSHVEATLSRVIPTTALAEFALPGPEYLVEIERLAIRQYETCLLAMTRNAASYLQWLRQRVQRPGAGRPEIRIPPG